MISQTKVELSIILVNWNGGQVIINCIESLIKTIKHTSYEIIVVDNNSQDGSLEKIIKNYPLIKIIKNKFNNMFAGANNQGYAISTGKYIFILNPDTVVTTNAVDDLVAILKNSKEVAITCTLLNPDGTVQYNMHRGFPSFFRLISSLCFEKLHFLNFLPAVKNYLLLNNKFDQDFYIEQAAGAVILLRKELIEQLGYLFDEKNFPLLYNDVDLSYRIYKAGIKILCKSDIQIYHLKGQSLKTISRGDHTLEHINSFLNFAKKHNLILDYWLTAFAYFILKKTLK